MSSKPLVSGIIIFLNEEQFIKEAIDSVFAQTYDNWELLLVDDGSTDRSTAIARQYAEQYPEKVRYLEHENHQNRGMSASRNLGISNCLGEYVASLDADDIWLPHKLEQQVAIMESQPEAAMVYGPLHRWYSWNGNPEDIHREDLYGFGSNGVHPYSNTLVEPPKLLTLFLQDEYFIPGGALVKREAIASVGGYEEAFRGMYEDTVVHVKLCLTSKVFVSTQCWYKYRMHPEACTHVSWLKGEDTSAQQIYLKWVEKYLSKQGIKDPEVWQAFRQVLWRCRHPRLYRLLDYQNHISQIKGLVAKIGRRTLPVPFRRWLKAQWQVDKYYPPVGD